MLTSYGGTSISYDAIGNPTNWRNASNLTWKARELQSLTVTAGPTVAYEYNSAGIRTKKTVGGMLVHQYTLDGSKIIRETVTNNGTASYDLYYLYDKSGSVIGFIYNNTYYYFQKNLQGDVIRILDYSGNVVVEYTYDAWGKVLSVTGSQASTIGQYNPFRYRSYYYDVETGFYYLQSRYYDPTVGRFLNADGIVGANGGIQGYNMFAYCNNNPICCIDINGYDAIVLTNDGVVGHLGIMVEDEDGNWWHFFWGASDGSSSSSSSSSLWGCEAKTWYELYNGELNLFDINASAQYADDYDRILRLSGDFTSCVEQIKNPSGEYNLFNNNCAQKSLTILASADTDCEYMLKRASEKWRPTSAHTSLEESISRNRMYASTAGHKSSLSQGGASGVRINFVMMVK